MSKTPPNRPGIIFEVGARVEAQDYLQKWYPSRIEKMDFEEGKMLVHFDRWSHRYDEWIFWESKRLRPLEKASMRKEGLKEEEETSELREDEEVLARWTDCRYYPAKIQTVNEEGTYTVQFYDGVVRCVKRIHIKSMPEDAKGQDWIALVKAASAVGKGGRAGFRPRTSLNSSRSKEEETSNEEEDDEEGEEEEEEGDDKKMKEEEEDQGSERADAESVGDGCSSPAGHQEPGKAKKRMRQAKTCVAKRPCQQSAGCDEVEEEVKKEPNEEPIAAQQTADSLEDERGYGFQTPPTIQSCPSPSSSRPRTRRLKQDSGELIGGSGGVGCGQRAADEESEASGSPASSHGHTHTHTLQTGALTAAAMASNSPQRRRRSRRLASTSDPSCPSSASPGKEPDPQTHTAAISSGAQGQEETWREMTGASPASCTPMAPPSGLADTPPALTPPSHPTSAERNTHIQLTNHIEGAEKSSPLTAAPPPKAGGRTPKANKHAREPIMNTKRCEEPTSLMECIDLDHNKFKCQIPGCSKAFRKAKLLDYHLKYYHHTPPETDAPPPHAPLASPDRPPRTRATSTSIPTTTTTTLDTSHGSKRRRTVSTSSSLSSQSHGLQLEYSGSCLRLPKFCKKKRWSSSMSPNSAEVCVPPLGRGETLDSLHDRILKRDKDTGRKKEKERERRERKEKDPFKIKQKKKKKKKKRSRQHSYSDLEEMSLAYVERSSSSPLLRSCESSFTLHTSSSSSSSSSKHNYPRAILAIDLTGENLSDIDFLEDSTTESLLLSGDEANQDLESITMDDFAIDDEDVAEAAVAAAANEIVRCICQMDEENGFMIQCEECMCWQHSVCMGLLEDSIPDQYICYICRDPPGQRWSARYLHDKEWLVNGHMFGLSFLDHNYSHQNAKKIAATHQLLADVYSLKRVLHGLQLKMDILQDKSSPSLHLWARSWVNSDEDQPMGGRPDCLHPTPTHGAPPDTYIASEHSYQKPPTPHDWSTDVGGAPQRSQLPYPHPDTQQPHQEAEFKQEDSGAAAYVSSCGGENHHQGPVVEERRHCIQWKLNLLTHIEDVQNQLAGRMDLIEKELDVLESWLDFTGELEPPDPLARLPQLKMRIKQLLADLSKVQHISSLATV